ncbi:MAG: hypothetical protein KDE67_00305 [Sphingobium sp.]|nr:hypothetical protein [Sphingobium sp.]MCP5397696.1 hypothetical protein [Sphingomonas sp.]
MFKITGLDKLTRELDEAQKAFAEIDGELGAVNFDPNDPASIEAAIQGMEEMIDAKLGAYANNSIVSPMVDEMKEKYREAIIEKAAEARLGDGEA